jgi:hypothetical protein
MNKINRVGEKHTTNEGYEVEIIECFGNANCTIQFKDNNIVKNVQYDNIKKGNIKNPYHKSICGVGYFGVGKYSRKYFPKIYYTWNSMLKRCYSEKRQQKQPTYKGCSVAEEWHNFQVFAEWFEKNYIEGFELDKDILIKGNKVYSPETCCFVPQEVNKLFRSQKNKYPIGVYKVREKYLAMVNVNGEAVRLGLFDTVEEAFQAYKIAKEREIKRVADKYKNQLTATCYEVMCGWIIEITD